VVEVQDFRKITHHFRRMDLNLIEKIRKMSTCTRLNLEQLGYRPIMRKYLPAHWFAMPLHIYAVR
jgi:hypothetical protein